MSHGTCCDVQDKRSSDSWMQRQFNLNLRPQACAAIRISLGYRLNEGAAANSVLAKSGPLLLMIEVLHHQIHTTYGIYYRNSYSFGV